MAEIAGLKLITPSSVAGSGVSVSASGKVTFTAATSVSVNGCFDSTYDNYLVVVRYVAASGDPRFQLRLRAAGTDDAGSNYVRQVIDANGASVTAARATETAATVGELSATQRSGEHIFFYGPALTQPTAMRNVNAGGYLSARLTDNACTHSLSTSYDGFTGFPVSSSVTGSLTIYGLSQ